MLTHEIRQEVSDLTKKVMTAKNKIYTMTKADKRPSLSARIILDKEDIVLKFIGADPVLAYHKVKVDMDKVNKVYDGIVANHNDTKNVKFIIDHVNQTADGIFEFPWSWVTHPVENSGGVGMEGSRMLHDHEMDIKFMSGRCIQILAYDLKRVNLVNLENAVRRITETYNKEIASKSNKAMPCVCGLCGLEIDKADRDMKRVEIWKEAKCHKGCVHLPNIIEEFKKNGKKNIEAHLPDGWNVTFCETLTELIQGMQNGVEYRLREGTTVQTAPSKDEKCQVWEQCYQGLGCNRVAKNCKRRQQLEQELKQEGEVMKKEVKPAKKQNILVLIKEMKELKEKRHKMVVQMTKLSEETAKIDEQIRTAEFNAHDFINKV